MTYGEAFTVQPFGNLLVTMDMTGQQVIDVLEQQAIAGRPGGRDVLIFGVSAGVTFDYQASAPFGARVSNALSNGVPMTRWPSTRSPSTTSSPMAATPSASSHRGRTAYGGGDDLVVCHELPDGEQPGVAGADRSDQRDPLGLGVGPMSPDHFVPPANIGA